MSSAAHTPSIPGISPLAGQPAPKEMLIDPARLERDFFERQPDFDDPNQIVSFGTSGRRGSALDGTSTEAYILAVMQAICDYRRMNGPEGLLYIGKDTHAVSDPAQRTALEILTANDVDTIIQQNNGVTPTPPRSGTPLYMRVDAAATPEPKARLGRLTTEAVSASTLAGEPIIDKLTRAPGDNAAIGGLKVVTASGWFAARPSGTENIYKIYTERFKDEAHPNAILSEAKDIVNSALNSSKGKL